MSRYDAEVLGLKPYSIHLGTWRYFHDHADEFHAKHWPKGVPDDEDHSRAVADFITGMTDRYALRTYEDYFLPRRWEVF